MLAGVDFSHSASQHARAGGLPRPGGQAMMASARMYERAPSLVTAWREGRDRPSSSKVCEDGFPETGGIPEEPDDVAGKLLRHVGETLI